MHQLWSFIQSALGLLLRHPLMGTSIIPVLPDGRIVLIQRRDNGRWGLPGGMVNWGEDIPTSVKRELSEETGLEIVKMNRLVGVYSAPDRDRRFHSICVVVEVAATGTPQIHDPIEIMDVKAFVPHEIPLASLTGDHSQQLQDYFNGETRLS